MFSRNIPVLANRWFFAGSFRKCCDPLNTHTHTHSLSSHCPWPLSIPFLMGRKLQCHLSERNQGKLFPSFIIYNVSCKLWSASFLFFKNVCYVCCFHLNEFYVVWLWLCYFLCHNPNIKFVTQCRMQRPMRSKECVRM